MPHRALPNFIVIGAAKSGTTTLYNLLRQHPQVYMPFEKEPAFFSRDEYYINGIEWYRTTFFEGAARFPARGELSPFYLYWGEKVAPRLENTFQETEVKFVAIFRDPVERAYSYYWHSIREGREDLPFVEALQAEDGRLARSWASLRENGDMHFGYFRGGCYASLLKPFLRRFPRERFHFMLLDDLVQDPPRTLQALLRFLDLPGEYDFDLPTANPAALPRSRALHRALRARAVWKQPFKRLLPFRLRHWLKARMLAANLRGAAYPEMEPAVARALRMRYLEEIHALEGILGRKLDGWRSPGREQEPQTRSAPDGPASGARDL
jgi:hypothetical protein